MGHVARVMKFMDKAGHDMPSRPIVPSEEVRRLGAKLILEETLETIRALGFVCEVRFESEPGNVDHLRIDDTKILPSGYEPDLVETADGCADLRVVSTWTMLSCGIIPKPIQKLVDKANLEKFRGDAHRNVHGKWVKPSDWKPPEIEQELLFQGWRK